MSRRGVLFDLDGTLVDSIPDLTQSIDEMLTALGRPRTQPGAVRTWVGHGLQNLVERALGSDADFDRAYEVFKARYAHNNGRLSRPYPHARALLEKCRAAGFAVGLVTNKAAAFTHPLLAQVGWEGLFDVVVSGDTAAAKKPDPAPVLHALAVLRLDPVAAVLVGDSISDVEAGRRACLRGVYAVSYGYNHGQPLDPSQVEAVVDDLEALEPLLGLSC